MTTALHQVMHGVAIKKHASVGEIAAISGLAEDTITNTLTQAETDGRVTGSDGRYLLTAAGRMILESEYSRFYGALRDDDAFANAYRQFEEINKTLKTVITDWQTMAVGGERVPNDHSNKDYDEDVIGRLGDMHEKFEPVLNALCAGEARIGYYRDKLNHALEQAEDGNGDWVSDAKIDSYHTVWFELHEELLRLMGTEREE